MSSTFIRFIKLLVSSFERISHVTLWFLALNFQNIREGNQKLVFKGINDVSPALN